MPQEKRSEQPLQLGRRERQIMDVIYRRGKASVSEVRGDLPDPPSYSAVRAMLGFLEDKGYLRHEQEGLKYVYLPAQDTGQVRESALQHMVKTFFGGSLSTGWKPVVLPLYDTRLRSPPRAPAGKPANQADLSARPPASLGRVASQS